MSEPAASTGQRILVVDDEADIVALIVFHLAKAGYRVSTAPNGHDGLEAARRERPALIVLDLMLPGLTGTQLISRLRHHDAGVPIIVLTARDAVDDKVLNFDAGADDYLTKPFAFAELLVRIKALLRRGNGEQSNVVTLDGLEINRLSHQVKRNGLLIRLTSKEYSLLEYLAD